MTESVYRAHINCTEIKTALFVAIGSLLLTGAAPDRFFSQLVKNWMSLSTLPSLPMISFLVLGRYFSVQRDGAVCADGDADDAEAAFDEGDDDKGNASVGLDAKKGEVADNDFGASSPLLTAAVEGGLAERCSI